VRGLEEVAARPDLADRLEASASAPVSSGSRKAAIICSISASRMIFS
jgi:hypothetical protein